MEARAGFGGVLVMAGDEVDGSPAADLSDKLPERLLLAADQADVDVPPLTPRCSRPTRVDRLPTMCAVGVAMNVSTVEEYDRDELRRFSPIPNPSAFGVGGQSATTDWLG